MTTLHVHLIRFVCSKHNVDLECVEKNGDGNPETALYRINLDDPSLTTAPIDEALAKRLGIIDNDKKVLKPGTWYVFDHSSFVCPGMDEAPDDLKFVHDPAAGICSEFWTNVVEEVELVLHDLWWRS